MAQGGTLKGLLRRSPERGFEGMPVLAEVHARAGTEGRAGQGQRATNVPFGLASFCDSDSKGLGGQQGTVVYMAPEVRVVGLCWGCVNVLGPVYGQITGM